MLFNSYSFIAFFAIVLLLHNLPFSWRAKKMNLLLASYLFYAAWNPPFVLLLWLSTAIDFFVGKKLFLEQVRWKRKALLWVSLVGNLGMLAFFKYGAFLLQNFVSVVNALGFDYHPAAPSIILPIGISFYTFQTLSYTLDMYRRNTVPVKSLLDFSLFVTFLPQLVAGPIVRPGELIPQFHRERKTRASQLVNGLFLLSLGLFMKVVMADTMLSGASDSVFNAGRPVLTLDAWLGVLAFSGQIFFDFAGYSTCAIGIAMSLGFTLPDNFKYPYAAIGFSDFWRRWHITLSSWLRDYLYIPLGGNRSGAARTYINLMLTMLLGGLWHGASWTFVAWGALHGLYLCVERLFRRRTTETDVLPLVEETKEVAPAYVHASFVPSFFYNRAVRMFLAAMITFFFVNLAWVFFRAADFSTAWSLLSSMFGFDKGGAPILTTIDIIKVSVVTVLLVTTHWLMRNTSVSAVLRKTSWWITGLAWAFMLILLVLSQKSSDSFIYFQF